MRLEHGVPGTVYQNEGNGSYYVFVQTLPQKNAARIWPLEVFPNGLLIKKPMRTNVPMSAEVTKVGEWSEDLIVRKRPDSEPFRQELVSLHLKLKEHLEVYARLDPSGKGKLSRGSYRNKIINVERRIAALRKGLGLDQVTETVCSTRFKKGDEARLPSGQTALVRGFAVVGGETYVKVKLPQSPRSAKATLVPQELLSAPAGRFLSCL